MPTYKLETEVRQYLETLVSTKPENKEDIRRILLSRKIENLISNRSELKSLEYRAIHLMKKVDYSNINPSIIICSPSDKPIWNWYRHILSSAPWIGRPGRANFLFMVDLNSKGILGIIDIGSDLQGLGPRDKRIGWTHSRKFSGGLNHLLNVGTCVCVHPFGQLTGGKFGIISTTSDYISDLCFMRYGEKLAGVTTTSLYGKSSMYNRIKEFEYLGDTPGLGIFHLDHQGFILLKTFLKVNNLISRSIGNGGNFQNKNDVINKVCAVLKLERDRFSSHQPRGVYFAILGQDAIEYLKGSIPDFTPDRRSIQDISDWWKDRWYSMRYPKIQDEVSHFDFRSYEVDNQIDMIRESLRGIGEIDNADQSNDQTGGASPTIPLLADASSRPA